MIARAKSSVLRIGILGIEPHLESKLSSLEPDSVFVTLAASDLDGLGDADLDVVVASGDHPGVKVATRNVAGVPVIVVTQPDEVPANGAIGLARPVTSPSLRMALDEALGVPTVRRMLRSLMVEQDDDDSVQGYAFAIRLVGTLFTIGWIALNTSVMPVWTLGVMSLYAILRSLWWRLSIPALVLDLLVVMPVAFVGVQVTMATPVVAVVLPILIWMQVGYQLGLWRGLGVVAVVLAAAGVAGAMVWGATPQALDLAISPLAMAALAEATGAMIGRVVASNRPRRRRDLERFREALYDLSERQAVVALSFDVGTAAEEVLARVLRQTGAVAAVVLVAEPTASLQVAAAHNLTKPPPTRLTWTPGSAQTEATTDVPADGSPLHHPSADGGRGHGHALLPGDGTVTRPAEQVAAVAAKLESCLPGGRLISLPAVLDGELLGGILLVDPHPQLQSEDLMDVAAEAALAFDSVRLFNRLRAFTLDQERARIGRSLHDGVMQTLSHVGMQLDLAVRDDTVVADAAAIKALREHVLATISEMRAVVNDLRSVRLDRGLQAALEAMAVTVSPAGGPLITVESDPVRGLDPQVEEQFLRITQEAVSNAVRHAFATRIEITLRAVDGRLILQVKDDGVGFRNGMASTGSDGGGVGMTSIRQRAASISAGLDIDPGPGAMITVTYQPQRSLGYVDTSSGATSMASTPTKDVQ